MKSAKDEQRKTIEAYYERRWNRLEARGVSFAERLEIFRNINKKWKTGSSCENSGFAGKYTLLSDGENVIISKKDTDVDDRPRDELGRFAEVPGSSGGSAKSSKNNKPTNLNVKPKANHQQLQNYVNDLYSGQGSKGQIGNGTMMDAIRNEIATGRPTKKRFHSDKGRKMVKSLRVLISSGKLDKSDKTIARDIIKDIRKALNGR